MEPNSQENQNQNEGQQDTAGGNQQQQSDPVIPPWMIAVNEANNRERVAREEADRLRSQLNTNQSQQPAPEPLQPADILNNPEVFRSRINQDMQAQMAPVNNYMAELQRRDSYHQQKLLLKSQNPNLGPAFAQIETLLDSRFITNPNLQPTQANIIQEVKIILAEIMLSGGFQNGNQSQQPNNPGNPQQPSQGNQGQPNNQQQGRPSDMLPPHLRPSNRSANNNPGSQNQEITMEQLDENERRLAREGGWTASEFVRMRDCTPDQINRVHKQIMDERKARNGGNK